jgi:hypothetical protein
MRGAGLRSELRVLVATPRRACRREHRRNPPRRRSNAGQGQCRQRELVCDLGHSHGRHRGARRRRTPGTDPKIVLKCLVLGILEDHRAVARDPEQSADEHAGTEGGLVAREILQGLGVAAQRTHHRFIDLDGGETGGVEVHRVAFIVGARSAGALHARVPTHRRGRQARVGVRPEHPRPIGQEHVVAVVGVDRAVRLVGHHDDQ